MKIRHVVYHEVRELLYWSINPDEDLNLLDPDDGDLWDADTNARPHIYTGVRIFCEEEI